MRCHTVRTKNTPQPGLTTLALRTGRPGAQSPRDAAAAPRVPVSPNQRGRNFCRPPSSRSGCAEAQPGGGRPLLRGPAGATPAAHGPGRDAGGGSRAPRPLRTGTFAARPRVPGEGAARGTPAPPSWRPEARRGRRREPRGGRPGGEVTAGEGGAARPLLLAPALSLPRSAVASGRCPACGCPSPVKRAGRRGGAGGTPGESSYAPGLGPHGGARLPARRGPSALPGVCGDGEPGSWLPPGGPGSLPGGLRTPFRCRGRATARPGGGRSPVYPCARVIAALGPAPLKCLVFVFQSLLARLSRVWNEQRGSPGDTVVRMGCGSNS